MPAGSPRGERFLARERLRRAAEFQRCYREGRRRHGPLLTLHVVANGIGTPRLGITVSRKVGDAVTRNRLKRWTREHHRTSPLRAALDGVDLVAHFKPPAGTADGAAVRAALASAYQAALGAAPARSRA